MDLFGDHPWPDSATELFERPAESLAEIAAELTECHEPLVLPHWERIRPVLDADIAYRVGLLADGGARSLFSDRHPDLRWSGDTLTLADTDEGPSRFQVMLMPSVFNWPLVSLSRATSSQTTLLYPARGRDRVGRQRVRGHAGCRRRAAGAGAWLGSQIPLHHHDRADRHAAGPPHRGVSHHVRPPGLW